MIKINKKDFAPTEYAEGSLADPLTHTTSPVTVGSSIVGLYFDKGVIIASDTLISYGRLEQLKDVQRIAKVTENVAFAASGEYSDYQEALVLFDEMQQQVRNHDDNIKYTPHDFANYLARNCYAKRNKMNPLYMTSVIGGYSNGKRYLGQVDLFGTIIEGSNLVTGFAGYLCKPIIYNYWRENQTEEEVRKIIEKCFEVLFYRDCGALDKIQLAIITADGVRIEDPYRIATKWDYRLTRERANERIYNQ